MRLGLLTTSFPRDGDDSAGAFVLGFARALAARGHTIEVLAPEPERAQLPPHWPGVRVQHVPYLRPRALQRTFYRSGVPDNLARDPLAWLGLAPFSLQLARIARQRARDWDALFSHWALPCALAAGPARRPRRHVAIFHSADLHLLARLPGSARLARHIARHADALWFVNAAQERRFRALLPRQHSPARSVVSPMGIELPPERPRPDPERAALRSRFQLQSFSLLALGRLVPIKGLDVAIRALAGRRFQLLIAGDGPERRRLEALARALGAQVRFCGEVAGERKHQLLQAADAFVLPSRRLPDGRSEGLPHALLEALAHGLPVVAAHSDGVAELLAGTAFARWLVPPDDPAELGRALDDLHAARAMSRAPDLAEQARAIAARFSWSRIAQRAESLISSAERPVQALSNAPF